MKQKAFVASITLWLLSLFLMSSAFLTNPTPTFSSAPSRVFTKANQATLIPTAPTAASQSLYLPQVRADQATTSTATPTPTATRLSATPTLLPTTRPGTTPTPTPTFATVSLDEPFVFVSRQIPPKGSIYWDKPQSLPGMGAYSRFQVAAPGKLLVHEANGTLRTLVDGANPTAASLNLIDVNAPDVSYDGTQIVFAGLVNGQYDDQPLGNPNAWRLYVIQVDGTGLRQLTFSDQDGLDYAQFAVINALKPYDDGDPAWLPDGRIVFSSTRWPSFAMYSAARTSNLYVVNADGSQLHRITAERNGADRPQVDPLSGRIVFARWWRNLRMPTNSMATIADPRGGYIQHLGLISALAVNNQNSVGGQDNLKRNAWQLAVINPDGTGLAQFAGGSGLFALGEDGNHTYGGAFAADGSFYANFFPMKNGSETGGFGGIRRYVRGANGYTSIIGVTSEMGYELASANPPSYGTYNSAYASEPDVLPDGRLLISWAPDIKQDYGLYLINADGSQQQALYDHPGTTELRARLLRPRPLPPVIPDQITQVASQLPPAEDPPYAIDGTFTFEALNVYFNAPVDVDIVSAMPVGSANTIRFFLDHQRKQTGSFEHLDWPILLDEVLINSDGSVTNPNAPANLPLFEQIRSAQPGYLVPLTGRTEVQNGGAAHVAGFNYGRPGVVARCVGCHAGHTMIPVPDNSADAQWTNLAPGATVSVSSLHPHGDYSNSTLGLIDRKVRKGSLYNYWRSDPQQNPNQQWVQLTFPVTVTVRTVRLYSPRQAADATIQVNQTTVRLYSDANATDEIDHTTSGPLTVDGIDVPFADRQARTVRVEINNVTGLLQGDAVASLAEVEVIARGEAKQ